MERRLVPLDPDPDGLWANIKGDPPSIARCLTCDSDFPTYHRIKKEGEALVQYFSHTCPGCGSLDHIFGVSSPPETWTLKGDGR